MRTRSRHALAALSVCATAMLSAPMVSAQAGNRGSATTVPPVTLMLRGEVLASTRERARAGDAALKPALERLRRDADKALAAPLISVTDKRSVMPPSNDPHDYFSLSPYWWPDASKANGLPYVRRDGVTNPESKKDLDQPRIAAMCDHVQALALAWWYTGDDRYAARAAAQLRTWFVDSSTRMTPHLRYGQVVRGIDKERGSAIIDTRGLVDVVDAAVLLGGSTAWSRGDDAALRQWFAEYALWLRTSPNGKQESGAKNNHGSWYAAQLAALSLFAGDSATTREIITATQARIGWQIDADGRQPLELERTKSFHYSAFNVIALSKLAEMGRFVGVDLWHYVAPTKGSLVAALDRMAPFVDHQQDWPDTQLDPVRSDYLLEVFRVARLGIGNAAYSAAADKLPPADARSDRSMLLFGAPATTR